MRCPAPVRLPRSSGWLSAQPHASSPPTDGVAGIERAPEGSATHALGGSSTRKRSSAGPPAIRRPSKPRPPNARPARYYAGAPVPASPSPSGGTNGRPTRSGCGRAPRTCTTPNAPASSPPPTATGPSARSTTTSSPTGSGSRDRGTVPALRAMFNDAMRPQAGRLVRQPVRRARARPRPRPTRPATTRPGRRRPAARTRRRADPAVVLRLPAHRHVLGGARPGELDALQADRPRLPGPHDSDRASMERQDPRADAPQARPRTHHRHDRPGARAAARRCRPNPSGFHTLRGNHYPPSSRSHHWNRVRCAAGLGKVDLYTATRHYFGWYALNVVGLRPA